MDSITLKTKANISSKLRSPTTTTLSSMKLSNSTLIFYPVQSPSSTPPMLIET